MNKNKERGGHRHTPLKNRRHVPLVLVPSSNTKRNSKSNLDNNERQLHDKTSEQNPVLRAVEDTQTQVLCANQDGANNVSSKEHGEESVMLIRMPQGVKARQQNQSQRTRDREEDGPNSTRLIETTLIRYQLSGMSQPSLSQERKIEKNDCHHAAGDKQGFEMLGANVGDVSTLLSNFSLLASRS